VRLLAMKGLSRAPELAFGNHKNIKGRHWFHSCAA
jgi:hypothetical protein